MVNIDVEKRVMDVEISDAEWAARKAAWKAPPLKVGLGWPARTHAHLPWVALAPCSCCCCSACVPAMRGWTCIYSSAVLQLGMAAWRLERGAQDSSA